MVEWPRGRLWLGDLDPPVGSLVAGEEVGVGEQHPDATACAVIHSSSAVSRSTPITRTWRIG